MDDLSTGLSLADVAQLAGVERPVVSMWRRRELPAMPFPQPDAHGRFAPAEIVDWLEKTGRGNNPDARADLAIQVAGSAAVSPRHRSRLTVLLAARTLLDEPLADYERDDLLDEVDALDPDDTFLFSELDSLEPTEYPVLAEQADAIAEAAWHPRSAYERLVDAQPGVDRDRRLHPDLRDLLVALCRALLGPDGDLIDPRGGCCEIAIEICDDEICSAPTVRMPADTPERDAHRRYRVHGVLPERCAMTDDWAAGPGSVTLIRVIGQDDLDLIDEARLQMVDGCVVLAVGPASILTDALPADLEARRDEFVRQDGSQPAVLRAAVRLPAGLMLGGGREHLALWMLGPAPASSPIWVGDISGERLSHGTRQALLDDLLAALREPHLRAFTRLRPVRRTVLAAEGGSLVSTGGSVAMTTTAAPADDAARISELRRALTAPVPEVFDYELVGIGDGSERRISLGEALDAKQVRLLPGARLSSMPRGSTPLWTSAAVAEREPESVNLLNLTQEHPDLRLTEPRDVIFTTAGKPAAVLDLAGGSAVAYPARVLRVTGERLCPAAVVDAINAVQRGNAKWRTWLVPETQMDPKLAGEILGALLSWEDDLRNRHRSLEELRRIVTRSVLSGAIHVHRPHQQKGS